MHKEQISIEWFVYVNVYILAGRVILVEFSKRSIDEKIESELAVKLKKDLEDYFDGKKVNFDYPIHLNATEFTKKVLNETKKIPYGCVTTYGELAKKLNIKGYRAVGRALASNPIPILIPCHRVISKKGIGGYSSGIEIKRELLRLEGVL